MESDVEIIHEVRTENENDWNLCFQWVRYHYSENISPDTGYRFIWRKQDGTLQPARGQARIPNATTLFYLIQRAIQDGWFITIENSS